MRQYRHGVEKILLELPAGRFDAENEDGETAAKRELVEETGYTAQKWQKLTTLYDNPVKDTNQIHLFLAQDVQPTQPQNLDLTEEIEVVLIPWSDIPAKMRSGEIAVAGTVAALFWAMQWIK